MYKFMNLDRFGPFGGLREEGGADGDPGGAGGESQIAELQKKIDALTASVGAVTEERDKFKAKHDEAEKHRKKADADAKAAADEAARKAGDVDAIEASWKEKLDAANSESEKTIAGLNGIIHDVTVGATATALATELSVDGNPAGLNPHILPRLSMELREGKPHITVLKDGKPSALTLEELKEEISSTPYLAPMIKGSSASGAGSAGNGSKAKGVEKTILRSEFDALAPVAKSAKIKDGFAVVDD